MSRERKQLTYATYSTAAGYRDLYLVVKDEAGKEYELRLSPYDVQKVIYACANVAKQIGSPHPPIDWKYWPSTIHWPQVTTWMPGPTPAKAEPNPNPRADISSIITKTV